MPRTTRNVLFNILGQGLLLIISLASARLLVGNLSKDVFGLISFALLLNTTIASVVITGIGFSIIRDVSQSLENNPSYLEKLLQTSSLIYWGCALAAGMFLWLAAPWITTHWLHLNDLSIHTATNLMRILGISVLLAIPTALYNSVLRGMERMKLTNLIDVGRAFMTQVGMMTLLLNHASAYAIAAWIVFANSFGTLAYIVSLMRYFRPLTFVPMLHMSVLRRNLRLVFNFSLLSATGVVHQQADKLIVSALLPVANVGYYNFAYHLIQRATFMRGAISSALYPSVARLAGVQNNLQLRKEFTIWSDLLTIGLAPVFAAALFLTVPLFSFVFTAEVAQIMVVPMTLLTLGTFMNTMITVPHITAMAIGRPDIMAHVNVYAVLIMLPLTYLLIWHLGLIGAAITWPLYHVVMYIMFIPAFCRECLPMSSSSWYSHNGGILLAFLVSYGSAYAAINLGYANANLGIIVAGYLAASVLYLALAFRMASHETRNAVSQTVQHLLQLLQKRFDVTRPAHRQ